MEAEALVNATNFPGSSQLTIKDSATNILNSDGFAIFASGQVTATGASHSQAVQLNAINDVDIIEYAPETSFSDLSVEEASVVIGPKADTSGSGTFSVSDTFSNLASNLSLIENVPGGYQISNYNASESSVADALDIASDKLTVEQATLYFGASNSDFATFLTVVLPILLRIRLKTS